eukprot:9317611-Alexandrium_andersonii.AAC.1
MRRLRPMQMETAIVMLVQIDRRDGGGGSEAMSAKSGADSASACPWRSRRRVLRQGQKQRQ